MGQLQYLAAFAIFAAVVVKYMWRAPENPGFQTLVAPETFGEASDPALRALTALASSALPSALVETATAREIPVQPSEAHAVLREALDRVRDEQVGIVAIETAVKTVNAAKAESYGLLATLYLVRANVVRRVGMRITRSPAGTLYVAGVTASEAPSQAAFAPGLPQPAEDGPAPFAAFEAAAVYAPAVYAPSK